VRRSAVVLAGVLLVVILGWLALNTLTDDPGQAEGPVPGEGATTVPAAEQRGAAGLVPAPVAETRAQLLAAAEAGDHDALAALAPDDFSYTFGSPAEGGPAEYWRGLDDAGEDPLGMLAALLRLPYTLYAGIYTWPFAFDRPLDGLTDYERGLLEDVVDVEQAYAAGTGYAGWRAGIEPDGTWRFFVAGD
jgi:hypothetical protein